MSDISSVNNKFKLAAAVALAAAVSFAGCSSQNEPADPINDDLPAVTQYGSYAEQLRRERAIYAKTQQESSVTVSAGEAAGSQTEDITELSAEKKEETTAAQTTAEPETVTETEETAEAETEPPAETQAEENALSENGDSAEIRNEDGVTEIPTETSQQSETVQTEPAVSETAAETAQTAAAAPQASDQYDAEFFSNDLFIGDSISTGYSLYGFLNEKNVFAKVGLNPSSAATKAVSTCYGEIDISTMLSYTMPGRVYIMLGSNGIQWLSTGSMLQSTDGLVSLIKGICPDTNIVIVGVPPVTPEYDISVPDLNIMELINEYNASLGSYCAANGLLFVDTASALKNTDGYFEYAYAESDGMHFKYSAYKVLLSKIQSDVTEFEADAQTEELPEETQPAQTNIIGKIGHTETNVAETSPVTQPVPANTETVTAGT